MAISNLVKPTTPALSGFSGVLNIPKATAPATIAPVSQTSSNTNTGGTSGLIPANQQSNATQNTMKQDTGGNWYNPNSSYIPQTSSTQSTQTDNSTQQPVKGLFPTVASSLATFDPFKNPVVSDAYSKAQELNAALAESKKNEAGGTATLLRQAIPLGDQEGQARVLQDQYLKQQAALGSELQGQASIYQGGFTGTGQQQASLSSVGNLAPEATRYDTFGGSSLSPQTRANDLATQVKNGTISPKDAEAQMNSLYGGAGATFLNQALQGSGGYDYITGGAQADIKASQEGQFQAYQSAHQQAQNLQSQLSDLLTKFNLNPNDLTAANTVIQTIAKNVSDPRYQILNNYLADVASRYSQILTPPGGSATDTTRSVASGMLNGVASGQSIQQVMNALDQQAYAVSSGVKTIGTQNSNQGSSGAGFTEGQKSSDGSLIYKGGKWVKA